MTDLKIFSFEENKVRIVFIENEPWFVAKDVLKAMSSTTKVTALKAMIEEDLGDGFATSTPIIDNLNREQTVMVLSKPAVTMFVSRSRTELGKAMNRWLHTEVLPSIEKTGSYSIEKETPKEDLNWSEILFKAAKVLENNKQLQEQLNQSYQELNQTQKQLQNNKETVTAYRAILPSSVGISIGVKNCSCKVIQSMLYLNK